MKKPYEFNQLSKLECAVVDCTKKIKMNVLARKDPDKPLICFGHWRQQQVRGISTGSIPYMYRLERRPYD